jgi:basic membrane protein A
LQVSTRLFALGAASAIILAACGGSAATPAPATEAPAATPAPATEAPAATEAPMTEEPAATDYKACVAFDTGGLGDKGFNDLAMKGLKEAEAAGYTIAFSEASGAGDFAANIQRLIDEGCQTIITVGFTQAQATVEATLANTDIAFGQVDATWDEATNGPTPANFTGLDFQIDEAAAVAGYLASGFSKSGILATYGGAQFPGVTRFMDGLVEGANIYNEQNGTDVKVLGWDAQKQTGTFVGGDNPWGDPAKGEQLAQTFMDQGADVVHPVAGATGNGTIKAMAAASKWAIGVDSDQSLTLPEYASAILTSAEKRIDVAVLETIKKNAGGDMGGENFLGTIANGGVGISPLHDFESQVSPELLAAVDKLQQDIASGAININDYK